MDIMVIISRVAAYNSYSSDGSFYGSIVWLIKSSFTVISVLTRKPECISQILTKDIHKIIEKSWKTWNGERTSLYNIVPIFGTSTSIKFFPNIISFPSVEQFCSSNNCLFVKDVMPSSSITSVPTIMNFLLINENVNIWFPVTDNS